MARGKYLSLEEARKYGTIDRFCKEHPSTGDQDRFDRLFLAMAHGEPPTKRKPKADQTSPRESSEDCSETRTRQDTSEDASD